MEAVGQGGQPTLPRERGQAPDETKVEKANAIAAIGTPLDESEHLHRRGLEQLLDRQWAAGIRSILVAGTMGCMQLLRDETYRTLVRQSIAQSRGSAEVFVGCGDTSLARTWERIEFLNDCAIDGAVALSPYFLPFSKEELFDYYTALADRSRHPLYIYEIPSRTHIELEIETVERLADHPNIHGIKCAREWEWTKTLIDRIGDRFRILVVALEQMDSLLRQGVLEHLDGVFALMPTWTMRMIHEAQQGDWEKTAESRRRIVHVRDLLRRFGSFRTATALWNAQGVSGNFAPAPMRPLTEQQHRELFEDPIIQLGPC